MNAREKRRGRIVKALEALVPKLKDPGAAIWRRDTGFQPADGDSSLDAVLSFLLFDEDVCTYHATVDEADLDRLLAIGRRHLRLTDDDAPRSADHFTEVAFDRLATIAGQRFKADPAGFRAWLEAARAKRAPETETEGAGLVDDEAPTYCATMGERASDAFFEIIDAEARSERSRGWCVDELVSLLLADPGTVAEAAEPHRPRRAA